MTIWCPTLLDGDIEEIEYDKTAPLENELKYFILNLNNVNIQISGGDSAVKVINVLEQATASLNKKRV